LTGDFNARPEMDAIRMILATKDYLGTTEATSEIGGTFHGYSMERINQGDMAKIDYIFTNLPNDPASAYLVADDDSIGNFYSDHCAVCAYLSLNTSETETKE
jgi:endonuclease/exonuclease/phosphatase family metal-dependent hydrolase